MAEPPVQKKVTRSLTDQEYDDIFKSVFDKYCFDSNLHEDDAFDTLNLEGEAVETLIKDDKDLTSMYVDAFVNNSPMTHNSCKSDLKESDVPTGENLDISDKEGDVCQSSQIEKKELVTLLSEEEQKVKKHKRKHSELCVEEPHKDTTITTKKGKLKEKKKTGLLSHKFVSREKTKSSKKNPGNNSASEVLSPKLSSKENENNSKNISKRKLMAERDIVETGTWVQCMNTDCLKWRYLHDVHDPVNVPEKWTCSSNTDEKYNSCEKPEEEWDEGIHNQEYVFTKYTEGSVVWARMPGYPWWPGMIEIDPDCETFFECNQNKQNVATGYHVVFFDDKVSRAWIRLQSLKPFNGEKNVGSTVTKGHNYKKQIHVANDHANDALALPIKERLRKYGFGVRYKGRWGCDPQLHSPESQTGACRSRKKKESKKEEYQEILESLGVSEVDSELYLENAEEIVKNAESVLEEFFSSQSSSGRPICSTSVDRAKKKIGKINKLSDKTTSKEKKIKVKKFPSSKKTNNLDEKNKMDDTGKEKSSKKKNKNSLTEPVAKKVKKDAQTEKNTKIQNVESAKQKSNLDDLKMKKNEEENTEVTKKKDFSIPKAVPKKPRFGVPKKKKANDGLSGKKENDAPGEVLDNNVNEKKQTIDSDIFTMEMSQHSQGRNESNEKPNELEKSQNSEKNESNELENEPNELEKSQNSEKNEPNELEKSQNSEKNELDKSKNSEESDLNKVEKSQNSEDDEPNKVEKSQKAEENEPNKKLDEVEKRKNSQKNEPNTVEKSQNSEKNEPNKKPSEIKKSQNSLKSGKWKKKVNELSDGEHSGFSEAGSSQSSADFDMGDNTIEAEFKANEAVAGGQLQTAGNADESDFDFEE